MSSVSFGNNTLQWSSLSLGASINGPAINIRNFIGFYFNVRYTGASVDGTFKLQASGDVDSVPTHWKDISGATAVASGPGSVDFNISGANYPWVRIVFTRTSGTGTIQESNITLKGY